jgi:hypothetical protein
VLALGVDARAARHELRRDGEVALFARLVERRRLGLSAGLLDAHAALVKQEPHYLDLAVERGKVHGLEVKLGADAQRLRAEAPRQLARNVRLAVNNRHVQRRLAVVARRALARLRARVQEEADGLEAAPPGRHVHGRAALVARRVQLRAARHEQAAHLDVAHLRRLEERGGIVETALRLDVRTRVQEQTHALELSLERGLR